MVPNSWISTKLNAISSLVTKGATPTTYGYDFVDQNINTVRFIGAYNCTYEGKFKSNSGKWISKEADLMLKRSKLKNGDSIICIVGNTIGSSFLVEDHILPANINQNVALIRPILEMVDPLYLQTWITSSYIQWQVKVEASTQAQPSLSLQQVGDFKINLPPLLEQQKIAQILSTWDRAISVTEKLLKNSQQQKKALMQQLLTGKKRLLDGEKLFVDSWTKFKIREMGKITSGGTPDTGNLDYWDGTVPWLTPTDVTALKSAYVTSTSRKISELGVSESSATLLPKQSLMVCTRATIGSMAISTVEMCTNQGFKNITPNKNFEVKFIYYLLSFNIKELLRNSSGSTFLELSKKDFENIELLCPSIKEQRKIAEVLSLADQEIETLQIKLDCFKQEKEALMQQLLTGKKRVKVAA